MSRVPFDRLVEQHGDRVLRVCRGLLGHADAEDAWSETFLSALEAYPRLERTDDLEGWLVTIAYRKSIDVLRKASRQIVTDAVPDVVVPKAGRDLDLANALAALPERQQHAVVLHHLGGLPFAEVAAQLGSSPAAARKASSDGVRALRAALGGGA